MLQEHSPRSDSAAVLALTPHGAGSLPDRMARLRYAENFPVASPLLGRTMRSQVHAIYQLARLADDLADEPGIEDSVRLVCLGELLAWLDAAPGARSLRLLPALEALGLGEPALRVLTQWQDAVGGNPVIGREMRLMLSAFHWDARGFEPLDWEQFDRYARGSAASIGRMLLALHRCRQPSAIAASDAICLALQRINMLQDAAVDAHRGRLYLPRGLLRDWGLTRKDWFALCCAGSLGTQVALGIREEARAQGLQLARHQGLAGMLPLRLGLEVRAILAGGNNIVRQLCADPDVARRRPQLSRRMSWSLRLRLLGDFLMGLRQDDAVRATAGLGTCGRGTDPSPGKRAQP